MTLQDLMGALVGVPLDAQVEIEVYEDCADGENCGEYGGYDSSNIGSVNYNAKTNTVTLRKE